MVYKQLPVLLVILSAFSIAQWLRLPIGNTTVQWGLIAWILFIFIKFARKSRACFVAPGYRTLLNVYFAWLSVCVVRGVLMCIDMSNYWITKQMFAGTFALMLPVSMFTLGSPQVTHRFLSVWFRYGMLLFVALFVFIPIDIYHFYLGPVMLVGCFLPLIPQRWRVVVFVLLCFMMTVDFGARSQVIKAFMALVISVAQTFRKVISDKLLRFGHAICYLLGIVLLVLGITGTFNPFEEMAKSNEGKVVQTKMMNGQKVEDDVSADTRTFIYVEVLESALRHGYTIWGRTPARGNDSVAFGDAMGDDLKTGIYERHSNELVHTNVFTWTGLVGLILYSLLYFRASWLAVYRSNNYYIKLLGCFVAFRWLYGWVEDFNRFDIMNITLWTMIAMCCSPQFRLMTETDFKAWIGTIFNRRKQSRR